MNKELAFLLKVFRNAGILSLMYFISVWSTTNRLEFISHIKPILVFLLSYVVAELAKRYKLDFKNKKAATTFLF